MEPAEITRLIEKGVQAGPFVWADLGAGDGAFTRALHELLGPEGEIYAIDKSTVRIHNLKRAFAGRDAHMHFIAGNFTHSFNVPPLDGILMANAIHFVEDKSAFLKNIMKTLKPQGTLLIVEYDIEEGNHFVPYPLSFASFESIAASAGFEPPRLLATAESKYWDHIYAAVTNARE